MTVTADEAVENVSTAAPVTAGVVDSGEHALTAAPVVADFAALGIAEDLVEALRQDGITSPFEIQTLGIPLALEGNDLIGQARTGSGKTLAFGLPLLQKLPVGPVEHPRALVVVPTRELALQVATELRAAGRLRKVGVVDIYGGRSQEPQVAALRAGAAVVVGTPGRVLDLIGQRLLSLREVQTLVLDEADRMLDLGFVEDIERIVAQTPHGRQTMLFSATMPGPVISLARRYLERPVQVRAHDPLDEGVGTIVQHVFRAHDLDKPELLARVLQARGRGLTMVFTRTKRRAQSICDELVRRGFAAAAVHGDLGQGAREQALRAFRAGKVDVLVATDVAARGIDVEAVTHVVNYECPDDDAAYQHRIGRTGRAGADGVAITLVDWRDVTRWAVISKALGLPALEPAETYSTSPHLYEALDIPTTVGGTLPRGERTRAGLNAEVLEDVGGRDAKPPRTAAGGGRATGSGRDAGGGRGRRTSGSGSGERTTDGDGAPAASGDVPVHHDAPERHAVHRERVHTTARRRRTRGGRPVADAAEGAAQASGEAASREPAAATSDAPTG